MDRTEFLKRAVLDKICEDYENVDQTILRDVSKDAAECGFTVTRAEVVAALCSLISDGLAKAYDLSPFPPHSTELDGMPPMEVEEKGDSVHTYFHTYFYATGMGLELQTSDESWWPFKQS